MERSLGMVAGWTVNRDPAGLTLLRVLTQQNLAVSNSGFADARKRRATDPVEAEFYELNACELTFGKWLRRLT